MTIRTDPIDRNSFISLVQVPPMHWKHLDMKTNDPKFVHLMCMTKPIQLIETPWHVARFPRYKQEEEALPKTRGYVSTIRYRWPWNSAVRTACCIKEFHNQKGQ
eukprot:135521_1